MAGEPLERRAGPDRQGRRLPPVGRQGPTLSKTAGCAVARDEAARVTRYELRLPLADIGLKPGEECGFNFLFFDDDDGNGQRYRLQWAPEHDGSLPAQLVSAVRAWGVEAGSAMSA